MEIFVAFISGRSTLISSVLGSIGMYYLFLFPKPITVNNKLEFTRSNFFGKVMLILKGSLGFHGNLP